MEAPPPPQRGADARRFTASRHSAVPESRPATIGGVRGFPRRIRRAWRRHRPEVVYTLAFPVDQASRAPEPSEGACRDGPPLRLELASPEALRSLRKAHPKDLSKRKLTVLLNRLERPDEDCWLLIDAQESVCGYCWVAWSDHVNKRIGHDLPLQPDEAYLFDCYVLRRHRGRRLQVAAVRERLLMLAEAGRTRAVTMISARNAPSRASYQRFGVIVEQVVVYLPLLRRTIVLRDRRRDVRRVRQ